jgi:hypothetical protein
VVELTGSLAKRKRFLLIDFFVTIVCASQTPAIFSPQRRLRFALFRSLIDLLPRPQLPLGFLALFI